MDKTEVKDLSIYQKKYDEDISAFREFEALDFVRSLKNQNRLDEAIEVGKTFLEQRPDLKAYINHYGYALFNKYIRTQTANEDMYYEIVDEILSLTKQERFSPYEATVNTVIKHEMSKENTNWARLNTYLNKLDPTALSKEPFVGNDGREGESKFERWYRTNVRACFESGNYKQCVEVANQAMTLNIKWHNRNAYWIRLYRAKAHLALNEYAECEKEYLALQNQFFNADFSKDLYAMYAGLDDFKKANTYLIYDLYNSGYSKSETALYELLAKSAANANQEKTVALANALVAKFKIEDGQECEIAEEYKDLDSGTIYDMMIDEVTDNLDAYVERKVGKVIHYNEEKEFGSIAQEGLPAIFFRQADFIYDEEVKRRMQVEYTEMNTYDAKKQEVTTKAVLILDKPDDSFNFNFGY